VRTYVIRYIGDGVPTVRKGQFVVSVVSCLRGSVASSLNAYS